jgi:16S rRNA A1518/A1519 N6-dimethyltransferase RsmA/KsgA/DIM1 with predicted DNA glycosylase/AP lyase activity
MERILRAGFAHRRKTLVNSLREAAGLPSERVLEALSAQGLDARIRAQAIDPAGWLSLTRQLVARGA